MDLLASGYCVINRVGWVASLHRNFVSLSSCPDWTGAWG